MTGAPSSSRLILRGLGFFAVWVVLIGLGAEDLPVGVVAAGLATWASIALWPRAGALSISGAIRFLFRFIVGALAAGVRVARAAFRSNPPLAPGFIEYRLVLPAGPVRETFLTVASLQPGTLPVKMDADGTVLLHCLDVGAPIRDEIKSDEIAFRAMFRKLPDAK